ncbi:MAG: phosphoribosyl-ATP pyrophosphatase [Bacillota bacterium]
MIYETADLIYHLFIMLVLYDIKISDIEKELEKRHK